MKTLSRTGILVVLLACCCLVVAGILGNYSYAHISAGLETYSWKEVEGTLLESRVIKKYVPGGDHDTSYEFTTDIRYSYGVASSEREREYFNSTTIDISEVRFPLILGETDLTKKNLGMYRYVKFFRKSAPHVSVFYNPDKPEESVLWLGSSTRAFLIHAYFLAFFFSAYTLFSCLTEKAEKEVESEEPHGVLKFFLYLGLHLVAASISVAAFFLLAPQLISLMRVEAWIIAYTILVVFSMMPGVLAALQIPYLQKGFTHISSTGWLVVITALFFGFVGTYQSNEDPNLESYDPGVDTYIDWLKGDDPYAIRSASYTLARMDEAPRAMTDPLLNHLNHSHDFARKAVVFALSKVLPLRKEQYQRVKSSLFDIDEKITYSKFQLLGAGDALNDEDLEVIARKLLSSGHDLKMAVFRRLRGRGEVAMKMKADIYQAMDALEPGPAYAAGINLYASLHESSEELKPLLLKGLRAKSGAASLSTMNFLKQYPGMLNGSFAKEVRVELERIRDSSYGNRKEIASELLHMT